MHLYRFKLVDAGNIVRLLAPDVGLLVSSLFVRKLCRKLLRRVPQVAPQDNCITPSDPEVTPGANVLKLLLRYANLRAASVKCTHVVALAGGGNHRHGVGGRK